MDQNKPSHKIPHGLKRELIDACIWSTYIKIDLSSVHVLDNSPLIITWRGREYELHAVRRDV